MSLEELKKERDKNKKTFVFFCILMGVAAVAVVYNAYAEKRWGKLSSLEILLTLFPIYGGLKSIENEIKKRKETKE